MKKLKVVPANDTFGALNLMLDVMEGRCAGFISAPEVNGVRPEVEVPEDVADDVGLIVESSGSTGAPKRIELSVAALKHSAEASLRRLGGPGQWLLALTPQFIAGANVLIRSVVSDSQPVIMNTQVPFTTEAFVRGASLMEGERRYTSLVPAQLQRIAAEVDSDAFLFSTLRKFDAILVTDLAPLGPRRNFWSISGSQPEPTPKSPQDPSDTHPGPQGPDQDPDGSSYRFLDRSLVDFGSQKGFKMEPLGLLWAQI